ncbi:hypothetical protein FQN50_006909 [Emmonsiellopsis sp. PD_5]|nr:hypothetical protein FQN50_006909 [Emmonsiellopsis sp. PD_5]
MPASVSILPLLVRLKLGVWIGTMERDDQSGFTAGWSTSVETAWGAMRPEHFSLKSFIVRKVDRLDTQQVEAENLAPEGFY